MSDPPIITVVVPTYRRTDGIARLLQALSLQTLPADCWELVVVDDSSGSPTAEAVDSLVGRAGFRARVLHTDRNGGPARARNLGWRTANSQFLAFTDDDCIPEPEWLESGLRAIQSSDQIGIVQGRTVPPPDDGTYRITCFTVVREVIEPSPWFEGCNLFWRREALDSVGGFDENLGRFGEETSAAWTAIESGWERGWAPGAVVEHLLEDRSWRWHLWFHYMDRNTVYLASKHPGLRSQFWRPWSMRKENALFAVALAGLIIAIRSRVGLLLTLPYIKWLHPPLKHPLSGLRWLNVAYLVTVHSSSFVGKLEGSIKNRILVL